MNQLDLKSIPPQSQQIYHLLLSHPNLTAKEIGQRLHILPNAAYRSMRILIQLGFAQKIGSYPMRFEANSVSNAIDRYLLDAKEEFHKVFTQKLIMGNKAGRLLQITSVVDRNDFIKQTNKDLSKATIETNLIVSGLEVPAETILQYKRAIERGVRIKVLTQRLDEVNKKMFLNWRKMGIEVKYLPTIEARICIIDKKLVYFTSYNPKDQEEGLGVRFEYPPVARIMNELFEERWQKAKTLFK